MHDRRQTHEDAFDTTVRLEPECRTAIVDEVELDITTSAKQLEFLLTLAVHFVAMALDDRQIRRKECIAHRLLKPQPCLHRRVVAAQIVIEHSADAAAFTAMPNEEVVVALLLE